MDRLDDLAAFVAVIDMGSQSAAARCLGRSLQSINRSLMALERSVGVELVMRTTRQSTATEAGAAFYERIKPALAEIADARQEAIDNRCELSGLIRIGAPIQFASAYVAPAICEFMQRHPRIEVELTPSDREVDVLNDGLDVAVRIRHLPDSTLKPGALVKSASSCSEHRRISRVTVGPAIRKISSTMNASSRRLPATLSPGSSESMARPSW
jgi:DNA-binding transcriptional LysR family regulator